MMMSWSVGMKFILYRRFGPSGSVRYVGLRESKQSEGDRQNPKPDETQTAHRVINKAQTKY